MGFGREGLERQGAVIARRAQGRDLVKVAKPVAAIDQKPVRVGHLMRRNRRFDVFRLEQFAPGVCPALGVGEPIPLHTTRIA